MLVRDDVTLAVVDPPRPLRLLCRRVAEGKVRGAGRRRDGDLDDPLVGAPVDLVDRERARARGRLRVADGDLADDRLRSSGGEGRVDASAAARAEGGSGHERGGELDGTGWAEHG